MVDANVQFRTIGLQTTVCRLNAGSSAALRIVEGILTPGNVELQ